MRPTDTTEKKYGLKEKKEIPVYKRISNLVAEMAEMDDTIIDYKNIIKAELKSIQRIDRDIKRWKVRKKKLLTELENANQIDTSLSNLINTLRGKIQNAKIGTIAAEMEFENKWDSLKATMEAQRALERGPMIVTDINQTLNIMDEVGRRGGLPTKTEKIKREVEK